MILVRNLLITFLVLCCCFMVFKISSKAVFLFLSLLFVLPPLIFRGKKAFKDSESQALQFTLARELEWGS